jgi:N-acetylmuramoyl-L-alanine amidase
LEWGKLKRGFRFTAGGKEVGPMRKLIFLLMIAVLCCGSIFAEGEAGNPAGQLSDNPIRIVHPAENSKLPAISSTFVCGSVPVGGELLINGVPVTVHNGGGFLTMVTLAPGQFAINARLKLGENTYQLTRTIFVDEAAAPIPTEPLTIISVSPAQDLELLPGEYLEVGCKGSPGMAGYFTVEGDPERYPFIESNEPGLYQGVYRISGKIDFHKAKISATLVNNEKLEVSKEAAGELSLFPDNLPVMAKVVSPDTVLCTGPAIGPGDRGGYEMFPPVGTLLQVTGRKGDEYRVRLSRTKTAWINTKQVKFLLWGGISAFPVQVGNIAVTANGDSTLVRIPVRRKLPFRIEPGRDGESLVLSIFGAYSNTDRIALATNGIINDLSWSQRDEETYGLRISTRKNSWWGYDARFEGNELLLELRTPPPGVSGDSPLKGITIAVDAGHGAGGGAIGATGYAEGDANLEQALTLKEKLTAKGVNVVMIRTDGQDVPLKDRTNTAWSRRADLLISLHNNSMGYGGNPLLKHGYSVYYFSPMSLPLAREIHRAYRERFSVRKRFGKRFSLPDDGLHYGNLALTRAPQMPSVLIESAYMIVPDEEAYLKTGAFRSACAEAIIKGLERYVLRMRR